MIDIKVPPTQPAYTQYEMRRVNSFFLVLLLALSLAVSGVASATAPAKAEGVTLLLCADGREFTVTLDATGNPVPAHRAHGLCSDCVVAAEAVMPGVAVALGATTFALCPAIAVVAAAPVDRRHLRPEPRGPPSETEA